MGVDLTNLQRKSKGLAGAIRWQVNSFFSRRLWLLNMFHARFTVFDVFGAPGDTLLSAIVCRNVKQRYPHIRLNLLTPNPELVKHDPNIDGINQPETYLCLWQWYLDLIIEKEGGVNVLEPIFRRLGIPGGEYRARVYLEEAELNAADLIIRKSGLPLLAFNTLSKESVKNWPLDSWLALIERLRERFELLHLGDGKEPVISGVQRFAGGLTMRESMAVLSRAQLHVGPDSFLMHAANGLGVRSVIIFGGSRTPENLGYPDNINLFVRMPCGPCWIHENRGEHCEHDFECLKKISVADVHEAILRLAGAPRERAVG